MKEGLYQEVIYLQDTEVVEIFMEKYRRDDEEALEFLAQWDYGCDSGEIQTFSQIMDSLAFVNYIAIDEYMALWQTGVDGVSLYRRVFEEERGLS